jgi:hypothetical protein
MSASASFGQYDPACTGLESASIAALFVSFSNPLLSFRRFSPKLVQEIHLIYSRPNC